MTTTNEHEQALKFARAHDWGDEAVLFTLDGTYYIAGVRDDSVDPEGCLRNDMATIPATMQAVREFGGY